MSAILIQPKDISEFQLLTTLLAKMKIVSRVLDDEEWEELGLAILMKEADRSEVVSRDAVISKLRGR